VQALELLTGCPFGVADEAGVIRLDSVLGNAKKTCWPIAAPFQISGHHEAGNSEDKAKNSELITGAQNAAERNGAMTTVGPSLSRDGVGI